MKGLTRNPVCGHVWCSPAFSREHPGKQWKAEKLDYSLPLPWWELWKEEELDYRVSCCRGGNCGRRRRCIIDPPAAMVLDYRGLLLSRWELFSIHISPSFTTQFLQMRAVESAVSSFPNTSVPSGFSVFCWGFL